MSGAGGAATFTEISGYVRSGTGGAGGSTSRKQVRTGPAGRAALASHSANADVSSRASRSSSASSTSTRGSDAVRDSTVRSITGIRAGRRPRRAGSRAPGSRVRAIASASASSMPASSGPGPTSSAARQAGGIAAASSRARCASAADSTGRQRAAYSPSSSLVRVGSTRPRVDQVIGEPRDGGQVADRTADGQVAGCQVGQRRQQRQRGRRLEDQHGHPPGGQRDAAGGRRCPVPPRPAGERARARLAVRRRRTAAASSARHRPPCGPGPPPRPPASASASSSGRGGERVRARRPRRTSLPRRGVRGQRGILRPHLERAVCPDAVDDQQWITLLGQPGYSAAGGRGADPALPYRVQALAITSIRVTLIYGSTLLEPGGEHRRQTWNGRH